MLRCYAAVFFLSSMGFFRADNELPYLIVKNLIISRNTLEQDKMQMTTERARKTHSVLIRITSRPNMRVLYTLSHRMCACVCVCVFTWDFIQTILRTSVDFLEWSPPLLVDRFSDKIIIKLNKSLFSLLNDYDLCSGQVSCESKHHFCSNGRTNEVAWLQQRYHLFKQIQPNALLKWARPFRMCYLVGETQIDSS